MKKSYWLLVLKNYEPGVASSVRVLYPTRAEAEKMLAHTHAPDGNKFYVLEAVATEPELRLAPDGPNNVVTS